jgi:nitroimidazol reductase NimA-like FMN-containing flavoprotein (pyridoxamine 5'-phosphate oxidase superfamily)
MSESPRAADGAEIQHSDFGRRVAARRERLGLTREQLSERTGTPVAYLRYVEERPARPGRGFVMRIADALGTTAAELMGGTYDTPPGVADPGRSPELVTLSEEECRALLGSHGVGRIGVVLPHGPVVVPVNYTVTGDGAVAFRTDPGTVVSGTAGHEIAFEVDRIDDAMSQGWSVLVAGTARPVTDPDTAAELSHLERGGPWAGGDRRQWILVTPHSITGRRIRTGA